MDIFDGMHIVTKRAIAITLALIIVFCAGFFAGMDTNINGVLQSDELMARINNASSQSVPTQAPTQAPTETPTEAPTQAAPSGTTDTPDVPATEAPAASDGQSTGAPTSKAEIIELFNKSANRIKTDASAVVRNWEDLHADNEYLEVPSALETIGKTLMGTFLKKDETPITWSTKEDIKANFPVKNQDFVSNATEADVAEATCNDDGTYYNIVLTFNECTDPTGTGCANAFNIINPDEVYEAASVVQNFSCKYYNAKIECKIEKETGNIVSATYTLPIIMNVTAKVLVTLDAQVGMTFVDDYSISY